jgi:hypothetical protein
VLKEVGRRKEENFGMEEFKAPAQGQRVTVGRPPAATRNLTDCELLIVPPLFFQIFFF